MSMPVRPKSLTNAIKLLAIWLVILFVIEIVQLCIRGVPDVAKFSASQETLTVPFYIVILIVVFAIQYLFLLGLWWAQNWVRILYAMIFIIGFLGFLYSLTWRPAFDQAQLINLIFSAIGWILNFYLVIKLFSKPANHWFKSVKLEKKL
ncbi:hypothetical protein L3V82_00940 [Thiotrichales bacterium 19S3-7]|nr:hypothetical protein [Thiotrichales bacterium 19S3-7]MCF6800728.1 hypothetical protein [Thiotrichales bacterium 19S3-11]